MLCASEHVSASARALHVIKEREADGARRLILTGKLAEGAHKPCFPTASTWSHGPVIRDRSMQRGGAAGTSTRHGTVGYYLTPVLLAGQNQPEQ